MMLCTLVRIWAGVLVGSFSDSVLILKLGGIIFLSIYVSKVSLNSLFSSSVHRILLIFGMPSSSGIQKQYY